MNSNLQPTSYEVKSSTDRELHVDFCWFSKIKFQVSSAFFGNRNFKPPKSKSSLDEVEAETKLVDVEKATEVSDRRRPARKVSVERRVASVRRRAESASEKAYL